MRATQIIERHDEVAVLALEDQARARGAADPLDLDARLMRVRQEVHQGGILDRGDVQALVFGKSWRQASPVSGNWINAPILPASAISAIVTAMPPSDTS